MRNFSLSYSRTSSTHPLRSRSAIINSTFWLCEIDDSSSSNGGSSSDNDNDNGNNDVMLMIFWCGQMLHILPPAEVPSTTSE